MTAIINFSYLILFSLLGVCRFRITIYLANCMHDLASNTELDSENHKMKVLLTPKLKWDVKNQFKQNKHV